MIKIVQGKYYVFTSDGNRILGVYQSEHEAKRVLMAYKVRGNVDRNKGE